MTDKIIGFARREADLAELAIILDGDQLVARARRESDSITASADPHFDDLWIHVKSGGRYHRLHTVLDLDTGFNCYHYHSVTTRDNWLRPIDEWHEIINGRGRFELIESDRKDLRMITLSDIQPYTGAMRYKVDVAGGYILKFLEDQKGQEGLDMDPDFQRGHVWKPENQTRYMEHLLRGGETSRTIIWNCPGYETGAVAPDSDAPSEMVIVDGKQRMTAIIGFLNNEVPVFGGHFLKDFDEASQNQILSPTGKLRMSMHIHALAYRHELLQLYIELNEGAIAHEPEEIARVKQLRDDAVAARGT